MTKQRSLTVDKRQKYANDQFKFYTRPDYYQELIERISKTVASDRIMLTTMSFKPGTPQIDAILKELSAAARRGVNVTFSVDAYTFLATDHSMPGPLFFSTKLGKRMPAGFGAKHQALEKLKKNGVRCVILNQPNRPFSRPFAGRCHMKTAIINDRIYIGSCDLNGRDNLDIMLGWDDKRSADWLYQLLDKIVQAGSSQRAMGGRDLTYRLDSSTSLLVDSGKPGRSLIFDKALELIDQAQESLLITCQYFPNSLTTKHLIRAYKRGVKVTIIYNHPSKHGLPHSLLQHSVVLRERARAPAILFKEQLPKNLSFLHAKLIATEKAAIIGSHNYITAGVNFGTAEIALIRNDPEFARQVVAALKTRI